MPVSYFHGFYKILLFRFEKLDLTYPKPIPFFKDGDIVPDVKFQFSFFL